MELPRKASSPVCSTYAVIKIRDDKMIDDPPPKHLMAGFDHLGNALEIVAIEHEERSQLVVIHAMKLQKQYYYLLEDN